MDLEDFINPRCIHYIIIILLLIIMIIIYIHIHNIQYYIYIDVLNQLIVYIVLA